MYPESMKQLPFIVSKLWSEQIFQGECHIFKAEGHTIKITLWDVIYKMKMKNEMLLEKRIECELKRRVERDLKKN